MWSLRCTRAGIKNWGHKVKCFLRKIGMFHIFECDFQLDSKHILTDLDTLLSEYYALEWEHVVTRPTSKSGKGGNKLRLYNSLKHDVQTEKYVTLIMDKRDRSALAKFRCGVAPLQIELGRYSKVDVKDRLCTFCERNEVEDECHTLLRCDLYADIQNDLFYQCRNIIDFDNLTDFEKVNFILTDDDIVRYSARVCRNILNRRKYFLCK